MDYAVELLREIPEDSSQLREACNRVAALQTLHALKHHGSSVLNNTLQNRPGSILNLYNTICNMANAEVNKQKQQFALGRASAQFQRVLTPKPPPSSASSPA